MRQPIDRPLLVFYLPVSVIMLHFNSDCNVVVAICMFKVKNCLEKTNQLLCLKLVAKVLGTMRGGNFVSTKTEVQSKKQKASN